MASLFTHQYRITRKALFEAKTILFVENDTDKVYILKDREDKLSGNKLSYFDIPAEFFQQKEALVGFTITEEADGKVSKIECIINGPMFRTMVFNTNEYVFKTFQEELNDKFNKKFGINMEKSSETIEAASDDNMCGEDSCTFG